MCLSFSHPPASVKSQLALIQKQKENIVSDTILTPLRIQLRNYDQTGKFDKLLVDEIKKKTKGFAVEMPMKKISRLEDYLSNFFSVSAQAGGCDTQLYIYTSTWVDYTGMMVYCDNYYSVPYNNCGHTYNLTYTMAGLSSPSFSLGTFDGLVQTFVNVGGYCEQAQQLFGNGNFNAGDNYSEVNVIPHAYVNAFTGQQNVTSSSNVACEIKSSNGFPQTGAVGIQYGTFANTNNIPLTWMPHAANTVTLSGGIGDDQTTAVRSAPSTKKGLVTLEVGITSVPTGYVIGGPPKTLEVCYGPRDTNNNCPISQ